MTDQQHTLSGVVERAALFDYARALRDDLLCTPTGILVCDGEVILKPRILISKRRIAIKTSPNCTLTCWRADEDDSAEDTKAALKDMREGVKIFVELSAARAALKARSALTKAGTP